MRRIAVMSLVFFSVLGGFRLPAAHALPNLIAGVCTMNITVSPTPGPVPSGNNVSLLGNGSCAIDGGTSFSASATLSATTLNPLLGAFGCAAGVATGVGNFRVTINSQSFDFPVSLSLVSAASTYTVVANSGLTFAGAGTFLQAVCSGSSVLGLFVFEDPTLVNALVGASSAH